MSGLIDREPPLPLVLRVGRDPVNLRMMPQVQQVLGPLALRRGEIDVGGAAQDHAQQADEHPRPVKGQGSDLRRERVAGPDGADDYAPQAESHHHPVAVDRAGQAHEDGNRDVCDVYGLFHGDEPTDAVGPVKHARGLAGSGVDAPPRAPLPEAARRHRPRRDGYQAPGGEIDADRLLGVGVGRQSGCLLVRPRGQDQSLEPRAWAEIWDYLQRIDPYELQRLVAGLLDAVGYHLALIVPLSKDGGMDVLAWTDPLGTKPPRIQTQVKLRKDNIAVDELG
jgi:hypothetical protein